jgi:PDZ domain-containing protein
VAGFPAVDILDPIVPDPPPGELPAPIDGDGPSAGSGHRGRRGRWIALAVVAVLLTAAIVGSALVPVPVYLLSPGSVRRTEDLITVQGAETYPQGGSVGYTTVSVQHASALEWVFAHLDDSITFEPQRAIQGTQTPEQYQAANLAMMTASKETASAVALSRLGYQVKVTGTGAVIVALADPSPSAGVLVPTDTIVAVDDTEITSAEQLIAAIGTHHPGDTVTLGVQPFVTDGTRTTEKRTIVLAARPDDANRAFLGVSSATRDLHYELPVQISVDSGGVGGPSAGLAFTLGIMDVLTPGSITGGHQVATTGTISADGTVGPIGGIHQKVLAVRQSGAELFLVPRSEYDEAEKYAGPLRIEPVDNIDDALKVLATIGGGSDVIPATTTTTMAGR